MEKASPVVKFAPGILGAFFLALCFLSCKGKDNVPDWKNQEQPADTLLVPADTTDGTGEAPAGEGIAGQQRVRFLAYNIENWLTEERFEDGAKLTGRTKPEKEKNAVIAMILTASPDILGLCELGGETDAAELQTLLEQAGHPLKHRVVTGGSDPTRRLALLSRYPISTPIVREDLTYTSRGKAFAMQRGILDATVQTPAGEFRFLGVHLKSKREVEGEDQEDMRRNEAQLLRRELDAILEKDSQARLVVYGDMNDTRQSPSIRTIQGPDKAAKSLILGSLKDSRGESWTQHWSYQDVYSRIDYIMLSPALKSSVAWNESRIMDEPEWSRGSDHRPLLMVLKKDR